MISEIGLMASNSVNPCGVNGCHNRLSITLVCLFFLTGLHYDVLKAFIMSFEILPIGAVLTNPTLEFVNEVNHVFIIGTLISALYCFEFYG